MANDNRRAGDWLHKEMRENANDLVEDFDPDPRKWYKQTFWIIFLLVVFWPVGIVLVWRSDWHVAFKILASIFVVIAVYVSYYMSVAVSQMQLS